MTDNASSKNKKRISNATNIMFYSKLVLVYAWLVIRTNQCLHLQKLCRYVGRNGDKNYI